LKKKMLDRKGSAGNGKTKKQLIKQQIAATIVVATMFAMVFGSVTINQAGAATVSNTILQQIIQAGSLSIEGPGQVNFSTITLNGVAVNSTANMLQVNMRDPRGSGAGWTVTGLANNMQSGTNIISNAYLRWAPGDILALDGSSNTGVAAGVDYTGNFADGPRTRANTSTNNGMGNYVINSTVLNLLIEPSVLTGTYQNTLTLTIS
jgi:hypothetical protein